MADRFLPFLLLLSFVFTVATAGTVPTLGRRQDDVLQIGGDAQASTPSPSPSPAAASTDSSPSPTADQLANGGGGPSAASVISSMAPTPSSIALPSSTPTASVPPITNNPFDHHNRFYPVAVTVTILGGTYTSPRNTKNVIHEHSFY
jgi:hypothetical protein